MGHKSFGFFNKKAIGLLLTAKQLANMLQCVSVESVHNDYLRGISSLWIFDIKINGQFSAIILLEPQNNSQPFLSQCQSLPMSWYSDPLNTVSYEITYILSTHPSIKHQSLPMSWISATVSTSCLSPSW